MSTVETELRTETIAIDSVEPHPQNARVGDVEAIAASLKRFGQMKPIVVQRSTGHVIAGNHLREAAQSLGWTEISAAYVDLDDEEATAYLIADNRTADRATYDYQKLHELLEGTVNLEGTGFDLDAVEAMADELGLTMVDGDMSADPIIKEAPETKKREDVHGEGAEPVRDVVMLMTLSQAQEFGQQVQHLRAAWQTRTVVETVRRAVAEAAEAAGTP